jgi:ribosomal protein S18 acetylase RimI-like enzyme
MTQAVPLEAAGMVFRRCRSLPERRAVGRLLAGRGSLLAGGGVAGADLFGLWDLTAPAGEALAGAAATGPLEDGGDVVLRGIAVAPGAGHRGLGRRLICEVADRCRARCAARLVARPTGRAGPTAALLRSAGFSGGRSSLRPPWTSDGGISLSWADREMPGDHDPAARLARSHPPGAPPARGLSEGG